MKTAPTQIRDIEKLKEPFKTKIKAFLVEMKTLGDEMAVHETFRTKERQEWLRKNGKSWVKVSNHQLGLAADVHFKKYPHFPKSSDPRWQTAWKVAKKLGIDNGQSLWGTDGNHLQDDGSPYNKKNNTEENQMKENSEIWHLASEIIMKTEAIKAKVHEMNEKWRNNS